MRNIIDLCKADLTPSTFKDIMFFSLAESGAMGEPGGILFYLRSGELYHINYLYSDISISNVREYFPVLKNCKFGMFGLDSSVPEDWNYASLGMGNHLIVHNDVYGEFERFLELKPRPSKVYRMWPMIAENILERKNKDKILCPLVDEYITSADCIENADIVDGLIVKSALPDKYKRKTDWEIICKNCEYYKL